MSNDKILNRADLDRWAVTQNDLGLSCGKVSVSQEEMDVLRASLGVLRSTANSNKFTVLTVGGVVTVELEDFSPEEINLAKTGIKNYVAFGLFVAAAVAVMVGVVTATYQVQQKIETVFGAAQ